MGDVEAWMARHNRQGRGTDQQGSEYVISYQPDWLHQVKVTRTLDNGRQSTKTLFRNPEKRGRRPASKVRTRISSRKEGIDFEIGVSDPHGIVTRIIVETVRSERGEPSEIHFTLQDGQSSRRGRNAAAGGSAERG
jgi:hypothetical protein